MQSVVRGALVALGMVALATTVATAQFEGGRKFFGPRLGLSAVGTVPSFGAQFEVAREDRIGIGAFVDYWSFDEFSVKASYIALAATGAYHFEVDDERLDPFIGLALGYFVVSYDEVLTGASSSRIFAGGQAGVRYFFQDNLAFVARAGFGASYLTVGLDFAF